MIAGQLPATWLREREHSQGIGTGNPISYGLDQVSSMQISRNTLRLLWVLNTSVFLAAVLPRLLGHPYPASVRRYFEWGGLVIYVVGGLCLLALAGRPGPANPHG